MAITGIVGLPGAGKTYAATRAAWLVRKGDPSRKIVANYPLWLPGGCGYVGELEEVLPLSNCLLILDELHGWMDARAWSKNSRWSEWISQLRKRDVDLLYTTQQMTAVDKLVRDRTAYSYYIESWKNVGFFFWRSYFESRPVKQAAYLYGIYWFSPYIAEMYDTRHEVRF